MTTQSVSKQGVVLLWVPLGLSFVELWSMLDKVRGSFLVIFPHHRLLTFLWNVHADLTYVPFFLGTVSPGCSEFGIFFLPSSEYQKNILCLREHPCLTNWSLSFLAFLPLPTKWMGIKYVFRTRQFSVTRSIRESILRECTRCEIQSFYLLRYHPTFVNGFAVRKIMLFGKDVRIYQLHHL